MIAALPARVQKKIQISESECWLWTAFLRNGYGRLQVGRNSVQAHRFVFEILRGPIADGLVLDHLCRVRRCVNPDHLEPVTGRENTLRGQTIAAAYAARTHCERGHPLETQRMDRGRWVRYCVACTRVSQRKYKAKLKGTA